MLPRSWSWRQVTSTHFFKPSLSKNSLMSPRTSSWNGISWTNQINQQHISQNNAQPSRMATVQHHPTFMRLSQSDVLGYLVKSKIPMASIWSSSQ